MKTLTDIIFRLPYFLLAALLSWLTYKMYKKSWQKEFTVCLMLSFIAFFCAFGWFQGFFKSGVVTLLINGMDDLGKSLNEYSKTTDSIREELVSVSTSIKTQQVAVANFQTTIQAQLQNAEDKQKAVEALQTSLQSLAASLDQSQRAVGETQTKLESHQKKLEDVSQLTKMIYEQNVVETFNLDAEYERLWFGKKADGSYAIIFLLAKIPIPQTVELQEQRYNASPYALYLNKNMVLFKVTGDLADIKKMLWYVSYVPDPTSKDDQGVKVTVTADGKFLVGGLIFNEYEVIKKE